MGDETAQRRMSCNEDWLIICSGKMTTNLLRQGLAWAGRLRWAGVERQPRVLETMLRWVRCMVRGPATTQAH